LTYIEYGYIIIDIERGKNTMISVNELFGDASLTPKQKLAARSLFSQAYNIPYVAAISTIRKTYPSFNPKHDVHWFNLIDICNAIITDREMTTAEHVEYEINRISTGGFYSGRMDHFCGTSTQIFYSDRLIGCFGYCTIRKTYHSSIGRNGRDLFFPTAQQAIDWLTAFNKGKVAA
jgi:hypothetical protein